MAEIHVQAKKHRSNSTWIWIVLMLLVIAAVVYFVTRSNETDERNIVEPTPAAKVRVGGHHHFISV